jgi:hypothetical protein
MALTFNYQKCNDSNWTEDDRNIARNFCWSLMSIATQNVTEKNKDEILFRFMFLQKIGRGVFVQEQTLERYLDIINKMVGYETNVGNETRKKWMSRIIKSFALDLQNTIDSELRENQRQKEKNKLKDLGFKKEVISEGITCFTLDSKSFR